MLKKLMFNKDEGGAGGGGADENEVSLDDILTMDEGGGEEGGEEEGGEAAGAEGAKDKKPAAKKADTPFKLSRFQEFDKEIEDEDKLFEKYKKVHEENGQLRLLAQGRDAIEKDEDIVGWRQWLGRSDEDLYQTELANQYIRNGNLTKEAAIEKAKERLATAKEKNPSEIEDAAMKVRAGLRSAIQDKETKHNQALEGAGKTLDLTKVDNTVIDAARKLLSKTESFLGMNISKNEATKKKMLGEAEQVLTPTELATALKDPEFIVQLSLLRKFGPQYAASIASKGNGKAKVILSLPKAPASAGAGAQTVKKAGAKTPDKGSKGFNAKDFK